MIYLSIKKGEILFKVDIPDDKKNREATGEGNRVSIHTSDKLEERFKLLDVSAELRASFMAGLFKVSGSGKYLEDTKKSSKSSSMTLVYSVSTVSEKLYLTQLQEFIDFDVLQRTKATHILIGINYGSNCTVTAKYEYSNDSENFQISGNLSAQFQRMKKTLDIKGKAKLDFDTKDKQNEMKFDFSWTCDVAPEGSTLPTTFEEARDLAVTLPTLVSNTPNGKGVPLKFKFVSVTEAREWLKLNSTVHLLLRSIDQSTISDVMNVSTFHTIIEI